MLDYLDVAARHNLAHRHRNLVEPGDRRPGYERADKQGNGNSDRSPDTGPATRPL